MIDTSSLSGYAAAYANALNNGASDSQAHNAATVATGGNSYSYFTPSGYSTSNVDYNSPYASQYSSLIPSVQQPTKSNADKVSSSLIPDIKTTSKDLLGYSQYGNAYYYDSQGNPTAVNFSDPNWQTAWTDLFGPGNQVVTDSTNPSLIGKTVEKAFGRTANDNPVIWSQQASTGSLYNNQGNVIGVSPTVQQLAQSALDKVNADKGVTQQNVIDSFNRANNAYWKGLDLPVPDYYNYDYTWSPLTGLSYQDYLNNELNIDSQLAAHGLTSDRASQLSSAEKAEALAQYRGGY
ncbi:MAG: hypothetical protein ABFD08_15270 [Syntrophomonas sp.]